MGSKVMEVSLLPPLRTVPSDSRRKKNGRTHCEVGTDSLLHIPGPPAKPTSHKVDAWQRTGPCSCKVVLSKYRYNELIGVYMNSDVPPDTGKC